MVDNKCPKSTLAESADTPEPIKSQEPVAEEEDQSSHRIHNPISSRESQVPTMRYNLASSDVAKRDCLTPDDNDWTDSNASYNKIASRIVGVVQKHLEKQDESKEELKKNLSSFFRFFLIFQLSVVAALLIGKMVCKIIWPSIEPISDELIITFITSVFVETLGGIVLMIAYAFSSKSEVQIAEILSDVIKNFKKDSLDDPQ